MTCPTLTQSCNETELVWAAQDTPVYISEPASAICGMESVYYVSISMYCWELLNWTWELFTFSILRPCLGFLLFSEIFTLTASY